MFFESFLLNLTVISVLIVALIFDYVTKFFNYWYIRYIPYKTPVPFVGSDYHRVLGLRNTTQEVNNLYSKYTDAKFVGCVKSRIPDLVIRDVDAAQKVLSTDFENFHSRGLDLDKCHDICLRNNLFYADGEKWTLLRECMESLLKGMNSQCDLRDCLSGINGDLNVQHLLTNVLDTIFKEMLASNEDTVLTDIRMNIQRRNVLDKLKSYIKNIFPSLYKSFGLMTLPGGPGGQPSNESLKTLQKSKLMNELTKTRSVLQSQETEKKKKNDSDVDFTFSFLASFISEGYIPCHNLLTAMLYELARNPQVQKKARETNQNEDIYLEKVINEVLRLHPPYSVITRKCVKTYKFSDNKMLVDRGVTINVPVDALHRDSKYYKEAEAFNPDRFSNEECSSRHPCAFLPFGAGPRKCIGEQLARQIVGNVTSSILKTFQIAPTEKTPTELPMADYNFGRVVDRDIWLRFTPIRS